MCVGIVVVDGVFEGRQDDVAVSVVVAIAHPLGHAVSQGKWEVVVGVAEQRLFGPGIVVVLFDLLGLSLGAWKRGGRHT